MKRTENINIGGVLFYVDEDAYQELKAYMGKIEQWFASKDDGKDIVQDIELRLCELFTEMTGGGRLTVSVAMVRKAVESVGQPEEFDADYSESSTNGQHKRIYSRRLYRDKMNSVFGGVCAGLAAYFNIDVLLVRIIFVVLGFMSLGTMLLMYVIMLIAVPKAITPSQRLEMSGEPINFANIGRQMDEGFKTVSNEVRDIKNSKDNRKWLHIAIAVAAVLLILPKAIHWGHIPLFWIGAGIGGFAPFFAKSMIGLGLVVGGLLIRNKWRLWLLIPGILMLIVTLLMWIGHILCSTLGIFC